MGQRRTVIRLTAATAAALAGGALCAGQACAQSDPWSINDQPGSTSKSVSAAAGSIGAKSASGMQKFGSEASSYTSYGVTHPGEVMNKSASAAKGVTYEETRSGFVEAAESPIRDFNLMQKEIPGILKAAEKSPYDSTGLDSCKAISEAVLALDLALGPDVDTPNEEKIQDPYARSAHFMANAALDAVKDATTHIIPARNTIRRLSGASRYDRDVRLAIQAGGVRRGFLKAYGMMRDCEWPAAPFGFTPLHVSNPAAPSGVDITKVTTIAKGPMVVTVSNVSLAGRYDPQPQLTPVVADATPVSPVSAAATASVMAQPASLGFAGGAVAPAAGAWRIGRATPATR